MDESVVRVSSNVQERRLRGVLLGFWVFGGDLSWVCGTFELKQGGKESYDRKMGLWGV